MKKLEDVDRLFHPVMAGLTVLSYITSSVEFLIKLSKGGFSEAIGSWGAVLFLVTFLIHIAYLSLKQIIKHIGQKQASTASSEERRACATFFGVLVCAYLAIMVLVFVFGNGILAHIGAGKMIVLIIAIPTLFTVLSIGLKMISPMVAAEYQDRPLVFTLLPTIAYIVAAFYMCIQQYGMVMGFIIGIFGSAVVVIEFSGVPYLVGLFVSRVLKN